jgi:hypothetical protein
MINNDVWLYQVGNYLRSFKFLGNQNLACLCLEYAVEEPVMDDLTYVDNTQVEVNGNSVEFLKKQIIKYLRDAKRPSHSRSIKNVLNYCGATTCTSLNLVYSAVDKLVEEGIVRRIRKPIGGGSRADLWIQYCAL